MIDTGVSIADYPSMRTVESESLKRLLPAGSGIG